MTVESVAPGVDGYHYRLFCLNEDNLYSASDRPCHTTLHAQPARFHRLELACDLLSAHVSANMRNVNYPGASTLLLALPPAFTLSAMLVE